MKKKTELKKRVMWTKSMILELVSNWQEKNSDEIAESLGIEKEQVAYMACILRKKGVSIPSKRRNGACQSLVDEFLTENPQFRKKK